VLFTVVIGGVTLYGVKSVRQAVEQYTAQSAPPLDSIAVDSVTMESANSKFVALQKAYSERTPHSIELSEGELNAIIQSSSWRNKVRVLVVGDELAATFSFPLSDLGDWQAASIIFGDIGGRALRGDAQGRFVISDGKASLTLSKLNLNQRPLEDMARSHAAEWMMGAFHAAVSDDGPSVDRSEPPEALKRIEKIAVEDGRLKVQIR
jgi:hypothetical protein